METINGLTPEQYRRYWSKLRSLPCERGPIDKLDFEAFGPSQSPSYPDEWYADKNNRLDGRPTGHLRCLVSQGGKMEWVPSRFNTKEGK